MPRRRPFVGRVDEVATLSGLLADVARGLGCVVLVHGPPGIGKTRLIEEALATAPGRLRVGRGYAADDLGTPPLWPWLRACSTAGLTGSLPTLSQAPLGSSVTEAEVTAERLRWMSTIADELIELTADEPLVLVLEDLQWADSATLQLLRTVAAAVPTAALAVVASSRPGSPEVETTSGLIRRYPASHAIRLEPLSVREVASYLAETGVSPSAAGRVHRDTGGLPLLLTAARPGQVSPTPYDIRSVALAMLTEAGPVDRPILETAAVLGDEIDEEMLVSTAGTSADAVQHALEAGSRSGLLDEQSLHFSHALLREGVVATLSPSRLKELHRRAGLALAVQPSQASRAAAHLRLAGHDPEVLDVRGSVSRAAAAEAIGALAYDDAVRFLSDVEDVVVAQGWDDVAIAELRLELATAQYLAGRPVEALATCRRVSATTSGAGRPDLVAGAALVVRGLSFPEADETNVALAEAALAEDGQSDGVRSRLLSQIATAHAGAGRSERAEAFATRSWALAQKADDPEAYLDAARAREATLIGPLDEAERLRLGDGAARYAARLGRTVPAVLAQGWRVRAGYAMGRPDVVRDGMDELASLAARTGLPLAQWHLARAVAARASLEGRFDEAEAANVEAGELAMRSGDLGGAALTTALRVHVALVRGDPLALPSQEAFAQEWPLPLVRLMRASSSLLLGDREAAEADYLVLRRLLWHPEVDLRWGGVLLRLIDLIEAFDDREAAIALAAELRPWLAIPGLLGIHTAYFGPAVAGQLGRALVAAGEVAAAESWLRTALEVSDDLGAAPYVATTTLDLATLVAGRDPREAARLARVAAAQARGLGMPGSLLRADRLLTDLSRSGRASDPLSPREREIAELVVAASSNRQIAERLFISERTVETHVRNILAKLGCVNRTELTARWRELAP